MITVIFRAFVSGAEGQDQQPLLKSGAWSCWVHLIEFTHPKRAFVCRACNEPSYSLFLWHLYIYIYTYSYEYLTDTTVFVSVSLSDYLWSCLSWPQCKESEKVWPYGCVKLAIIRCHVQEIIWTCFNEGLSNNCILWDTEAAAVLRRPLIDSSCEEKHFACTFCPEPGSPLAFQECQWTELHMDLQMSWSWILQNVPIRRVWSHWQEMNHYVRLWRKTHANS